MKKVLLSLLSAGVLASSCANQAAENPLLVEWNTPYGIPPFEQVQPEHYLPAFKAAMAAEIAEIDAIVAEVTKAEPEYDFVAEDGFGHTLWVVPTEYNEQITSVFATIPALYVADGHHRTAAAARVGAAGKCRSCLSII